MFYLRKKIVGIVFSKGHDGIPRMPTRVLRFSLGTKSFRSKINRLFEIERGNNGEKNEKCFSLRFGLEFIVGMRRAEQ